MKLTFTYEPNATPARNYDAVIRPIRASELKEHTIQSQAWIHPLLDQAVKDLHAKGLFKAAAEQAEFFPTLGQYPTGHAVYIGVDEEASATGIRLLGAAAARAIKRLKAAAVQLIVPSVQFLGTITAAEAAQAITEGLYLGLYERPKKSAKEQDAPDEHSIHIVFQEGSSPSLLEEWQQGEVRGKHYATGALLARSLVNMPGNELTPEKLAEQAELLAAQYEFESEILDEWDAAEQRMGGLLAVGQGSIHPPRMIVLHYKGDPGQEKTWGLIGKGITFDTGGISIKPAANMEEMISDMGGAAAVLGAMRIIGELKPQANVIAVIPTAENMPSDRAMKPGDVITAMNGTTIEIVNTDAEGRLVLADGLTTAILRGATHLVDVATLTGGVVVALGNVTTGAMTNNEELLREVEDASHRSGERIWQLPTHPEYRKLLDSDAADMKNSAGRAASAITGALFVGAFAQEKPWVHLDIAGTAFLNKSRGWEAKGATGVMARTLAELVIGKK